MTTVHVTTEQAARNRAADGVSAYGALCTFLEGAEVTTLDGLRGLFERDAQDMLNCTGFADHVPNVAELFPLTLRWIAEHTQH